jgi:hypothetical protein
LDRTPEPATLGLARFKRSGRGGRAGAARHPRDASRRLSAVVCGEAAGAGDGRQRAAGRAALARASRDPLAGVVLIALAGLAGASALAWLTAGDDYARRVEPYRGYGLDLWLALAAALLAGRPREQATAVAVATLGWLASAPAGDVLARFDAEPAHAHHHLSAAHVRSATLARAEPTAAAQVGGARASAPARGRSARGGTGAGGATEPLGSSTSRRRRTR